VIVLPQIINPGTVRQRNEQPEEH